MEILLVDINGDDALWLVLLRKWSYSSTGLIMRKMISLVNINGDGALVLLSNLALVQVVHNTDVPGGQNTPLIGFFGINYDETDFN